MAKKTRMAVGLAAVALLGWSRTAAADEAAVAPAYMATETHLRWETEALGVAIQDAIERSTTFRELVAAINASDSYVIISAGHCGHGVRACFVSVRSSGARRYLFVQVDPARRDGDLMAAIGHELRHTVEVIQHPAIKTDAEKFFFYERTAMHGPSGARETVAAMDAGNAVRAEIDRFNRQSHTR